MYKEFPYPIDPRLKNKLNLLAKTLKKKDVWIMIDGDEGSGKSNTMAYILYYFHCLTGRDFTLDRIYFDSDDMFEWVKENSNGLIGWDEMVLGGLSTEWYTKSQTNLLKFAMVGRKKHHVFVMCVPRFDKIKYDLRSDRIHALIHLDLGKKMNNYGHFIYLTRRGIKALNRYWAKKKVRAYNVCAKRNGGFFCNINVPYVFNELFDEDEYENMKDNAISSIGEVKKDKLTVLQQKQLKQRDILIKYMYKNENLSQEKLTNKLNSMGIDLKKTVIGNIVRLPPP